MKLSLSILGPNVTAITVTHVANSAPNRVVFSYEEPIGITLSDGTSYRTTEFHSVTTWKHMTRYISMDAIPCDRKQFMEIYDILFNTPPAPTHKPYSAPKQWSKPQPFDIDA